MNTRIKKLRKELNLTQQEFADRIAVNRSTIATYEIGRNTPLDAVIAAICREFSVNETWLRTGEGAMFQAPQSVDTELAGEIGKLLASDDEFTKALFLRYLKLPPVLRKQFEDFLRSAVEDSQEKKDNEA